MENEERKAAAARERQRVYEERQRGYEKLKASAIKVLQEAAEGLRSPSDRAVRRAQKLLRSESNPGSDAIYRRLPGSFETGKRR